MFAVGVIGWYVQLSVETPPSGGGVVSLPPHAARQQASVTDTLIDRLITRATAR
jgi:hypothetical protein